MAAMELVTLQGSVGRVVIGYRGTVMLHERNWGWKWGAFPMDFGPFFSSVRHFHWIGEASDFDGKEGRKKKKAEGTIK